MHSLTKKTLSHLLFFLNELPLIRTQEDNLTGLRAITKKALHMLSGQWQVSMQEAVHMVDNQKLVICSDMVDTNLFSLNVIPEMMKFDVEVFRPKPVLENSGHFESSAVVLEYSTMYLGLRLRNRITSILHFLQQFHHRDCISEGIA